MIANISERRLINNSLSSMYANAPKVKAGQVKIGTLVIARFKDDLVPEEPDMYSLLTIYRQGKKLVRGAFHGEDGMNTDYYELQPEDEVVVLTAAAD